MGEKMITIFIWKCNQAQNKNLPWIIGSGEFLFPWSEIQDAGTMKEGTWAWPPVLPLRWAMMTQHLFGSGGHRGSHSGGGETPSERITCNWEFPLKIELFGYNTGFFLTLLHVRWMPPPPMGAPVADRRLKIQKKLPARRASERPWGGVSSYTLQFSWFGSEPHRFMSVSPESIFFKKNLNALAGVFPRRFVLPHMRYSCR